MTTPSQELENALLELHPSLMQVENQRALRKIIESYTIAKKEATNSDICKQIEHFLAVKRIDGLTVGSLATYRVILNTFATYVHKAVRLIATDDIRKYISYLIIDKKLADRSLQTQISTLRSFFNQLLIDEQIDKNPMLKIKSLKIDRRGARRGLTSDELEKLRDACVSYREKSLLEFLVSTGCRISEVVDIDLNSVDFINCSVVVRGKGGKERTVYFNPRTKLMIEKYIATRKGGVSLFASSKKPYNAIKQSSIQYIVKRIAERSGLSIPVYPHLFRHTFASVALNSGMTLATLQELLGHGDVSTTQIYAKMCQTNIQYEYNKYVA